jgi:uncharacterized pyridoxamine 5'-phosphate oxidase family protein
MSKFFDLLVNWGEKVYQVRSETTGQMYHVEMNPDVEIQISESPKSSNSTIKLNVLEAQN